jgi:outer membrane protein
MLRRFFLLALLLAQPALAAPSTDKQLQHRIDGLLSGQGLLDGNRVSLDYRSAVEMSVERNLSLKSAGYDLDIARAQYDEAVADRNPTVSNNFYYLHQDHNLEAATLSNTRFLLLAAGYGVTPSQLYTLGSDQMLDRSTLYVPVYTGGRLESAMHLQAALARAQKSSLARTRQQVIYDTKQQYLNTLEASDNVLVAEKVLGQARETLTFSSQRLKAGVGTKYDVLQSEVAVANAQDALIKTQTAWANARADLAGILDLPILTSFVFGDNLRDGALLAAETVPDTNLEKLARLALGQRPELEQLRQQLVANRERENGARSGMKPQFGLNLNYDVLGNPTNLYGGFSLIAQLSIPIFDGGVSRTQVSEFKLRNLQLKQSEIALIQSITLEVRQALLALEEADARMAKVQAAEVAARETLRISTLRFNVGAGTSLELVTAQTVLANAQFALTDARFRQLLARATLNFAIGSEPTGKAIIPQTAKAAP